MPTLPAERVAYAYLYDDAQADDARLTLTIARTAAVDYGAVVANHLPVGQLLKDETGRVIGARGETSRGTLDIRARVVVNASGVWVDDVNALDAEDARPTVRPARGVHVVVPRSLVHNDVAAVMPVPGQRSSVFAVPWGDFTYIGTTDTDHEDGLDELFCNAGDIAYLLENINASIEPDLSSEHVVGTWVGLRPLLRGATSERTADLSRRHRVSRSASGVITVTGGKLTTYRRMAQDTIDAVLRVLGRSAKCRTRRLSLRGSQDYERVDDRGHGQSVRDHLVGRYGGEARELLALMDADPALAEPLVPGLPYVRAEARYAAREEMAQTLDDVLSRRTRARLLARDASAEAAESVARLMGEELGWSRREQAGQVARYKESVAAERESAHEPARDALARSRRPSEGGWLPGVLAPRLLGLGSRR